MRNKPVPGFKDILRLSSARDMSRRTNMHTEAQRSTQKGKSEHQWESHAEEERELENVASYLDSFS